MKNHLSSKEITRLQEWISISSSIEKLYDTMSECEAVGDFKRYQEMVELLKMSLEIENGINNSLIQISGSINPYLTYLKDKKQTRILNRLEESLSLFEKKELTTDMRKKFSIICSTISSIQNTKDTITVLEEEIKQETDPSRRKKWIQKKNSLLMNSKEVESEYFGFSFTFDATLMSDSSFVCQYFQLPEEKYRKVMKNYSNFRVKTLIRFIQDDKENKITPELASMLEIELRGALLPLSPRDLGNFYQLANENDHSPILEQAFAKTRIRNLQKTKGENRHG